MSVSYPLPGTKFYDNVKLQLGEKQNWLDSGDFEMMYHGPYGSEFYRQLHVTLHREFRSARTWRELSKPNVKGQPLQRKMRDTGSMIYNRALLPIERRKLNRLARRSDRSLRMLPQVMTPEAASKPTPQGE